MRSTVIPILVILFVILSMGGSGGCDGGGSRNATYDHGRDTGRLQAENLRLQEAQRQAAARLAIERRRSAQLKDEVSVRQDVEALMVGVVVMTGCALAIAAFTLLRRHRRRL